MECGNEWVRCVDCERYVNGKCTVPWVYVGEVGWRNGELTWITRFAADSPVIVLEPYAERKCLYFRRKENAG